METLPDSVCGLYGEHLGAQYGRLLTHINMDKNFKEMPPELQFQWAASVVAMIFYEQVKGGHIQPDRIDPVIDAVRDEVVRCFNFLMEDDHAEAH